MRQVDGDGDDGDEEEGGRWMMEEGEWRMREDDGDDDE